MLPVPGGHVEGVGGRQLEVDAGGVQVHRQRVEEGGLRVLPELQDSGKDGVPSPRLLLLGVEVVVQAARAVVGRGVGHVVGRGAPHSSLQTQQFHVFSKNESTFTIYNSGLTVLQCEKLVMVCGCFYNKDI